MGERGGGGSGPAPGAAPLKGGRFYPPRDSTQDRGVSQLPSRIAGRTKRSPSNLPFPALGTSAENLVRWRGRGLQGVSDYPSRAPGRVQGIPAGLTGQRANFGNARLPPSGPEASLQPQPGRATDPEEPAGLWSATTLGPVA